MESRSGLRDLWSTSGLDRTAAFSDAVLAIAMTILVLDLKAPDVAGRREYDAAVLAALPRPRFRPRGVDSVMSPGLALRQVGSQESSAGGFRRAGLARREVGRTVSR